MFLRAVILFLAFTCLPSTNADFYDTFFNYSLEKIPDVQLQNTSATKTKPLPREDKIFKKPTDPFLGPKLTSTTQKSSKSFCRKSQKTKNHEILNCYSCKDPKTGLNYEYCSKVDVPENARTRRSNVQEVSPESLSTEENHRSGKKNGKKSESCRRLVKNGMVCVVCKNKKTNAQSEQCSYVGKPREKAYAFTQSRSFGESPAEEKSDSTANKPVYDRNTRQEIRDKANDEDSSEVSESLEDGEEVEDEQHPQNGQISRDNPSSPSSVSESKRCQKIRRKDQTCMLCENPKTGAHSEKCRYEYQPPEKLYKFSRSKSYSYPGSAETEESREKSESRLRPSTETKKDALKRKPIKVYETEKSAEDITLASASESEEDTEKAEETNSGNCREVQKNSMTCTICKDPVTGGSYEKCAYFYQPSDKIFAFSKSKSFGESREEEVEDSGENEEQENASDSLQRRSDDDADENDEDDSKEKSELNDFSAWESKPAQQSSVDKGYADAAKRKEEMEKFYQDFRSQDRSKCRKILRNEMTCYECVDENGFRKEDCMFLTIPEASENRAIVTSQKPSEQVSYGTLLEPVAAASDDDYVTRVKPEKKMRETDENEEEAEPYETVSETKYKYDKVFGFSVPKYMLEVSDAEAEFDHIFNAPRI